VTENIQERLRVIDLSRFDFNAKSIKKISAKSTQPIVDVTEMVQ
jgi:hypothetical protein